MINLLFTALLAYLLGSIPTAYLFLRRFRGLDITREGSGNVGALNAYEVTRSRRMGVLIFLCDFLKGTAAILLAGWIWIADPWHLAIGGIMVVLGHNFSVWVRFRGGRGIAAAAGVAVFAAPVALAFWGVGWILTYLVARDIHWGNILASVLVPLTGVVVIPVLSLPIPAGMLEPGTQLLVLIVGICFLILVKHIRPMREILKRRNSAVPPVSSGK